MIGADDRSDFFKQLGTGLAIQLGVYPTHRKDDECTQGKHRAHGGDPDLWPMDLRIQEYPDALNAGLPLLPDPDPAYEAGKWWHFPCKTNGASEPEDGDGSATATPAAKRQ